MTRTDKMDLDVLLGICEKAIVSRCCPNESVSHLMRLILNKP